MEFQRAYHEIRGLELKISEYTTAMKNTEIPEIKAAYSTIQAVHQSTLTVLNTNLALSISTLMGKKAEQNNTSEKDEQNNTSG
jgi:hypothetical protein